VSETAILAILLATALDPVVLVPAALAGWFVRSRVAVALIPAFVVVYFSMLFAAFAIIPFRPGAVLLKMAVGAAIGLLVHTIVHPKKGSGGKV
jgi:hypothetical protein